LFFTFQDNCAATKTVQSDSNMVKGLFTVALKLNKAILPSSVAFPSSLWFVQSGSKSRSSFWVA